MFSLHLRLYSNFALRLNSHDVRNQDPVRHRVSLDWTLSMETEACRRHVCQDETRSLGRDCLAWNLTACAIMRSVPALIDLAVVDCLDASVFQDSGARGGAEPTHQKLCPCTHMNAGKTELSSTIAGLVGPQDSVFELKSTLTLVWICTPLRQLQIHRFTKWKRTLPFDVLGDFHPVDK